MSAALVASGTSGLVSGPILGGVGLGTAPGTLLGPLQHGEDDGAAQWALWGSTTLENEQAMTKQENETSYQLKGCLVYRALKILQPLAKVVKALKISNSLCCPVSVPQIGAGNVPVPVPVTLSMSVQTPKKTIIQCIIS